MLLYSQIKLFKNEKNNPYLKPTKDCKYLAYTILVAISFGKPCISRSLQDSFHSK